VSCRCWPIWAYGAMSLRFCCLVACLGVHPRNRTRLIIVTDPFIITGVAVIPYIKLGYSTVYYSFTSWNAHPKV
jgi:hypothetical protein